MKYVLLAGRFLFSLIFLIPAPGHFKASTINYVSAKGIPFASFLVPFSGLLMIAGGISILLGYKTRIGAWILILFLLPVTFALHDFWNTPDGMARQLDFAMFMKNIALTGSALMIAYFGAGSLSMDNRLAKA